MLRPCLWMYPFQSLYLILCQISLHILFQILPQILFFSNTFPNLVLNSFWNPFTNYFWRLGMANTFLLKFWIFRTTGQNPCVVLFECHTQESAVLEFQNYRSKPLCGSFGCQIKESAVLEVQNRNQGIWSFGGLELQVRGSFFGTNI